MYCILLVIYSTYMHGLNTTYIFVQYNTFVHKHYDHFISFMHCLPVCAGPPVISAQAIGPYSINVAWNITKEEEASVIHYEIQWSMVAVDKADDINSSSMTIHRDDNASFVLIRELLPATEYSFQVRVVATDGWGQWSHQVTAKTEPAGKYLHM